MIRPLMWFSAGLLGTVITFVVAYHTQLRLYFEEREKADGKSVRQRHGVGIWLGSILLLFAAVAFGVGCWIAASAIKKASRSLVSALLFVRGTKDLRSRTVLSASKSRAKEMS
jgi:hypothetical protein